MGALSPQSQVRDGLCGHHNQRSRVHVREVGSSFPFRVANAVRLSERSIQVIGVFFSFLYNNYITYAFIHYELISASQRHMTQKRDNQ